MNKKLLKWLSKPAWQILLWQWSLFGVLAGAVYLFELQPLWQQKIVDQQELLTQQNKIEQTQLALTSLPAPSLIQNQIDQLLSEENAQHTVQKTLIENVQAFIDPFDGKITRWQKQSPIAKNNLLYQCWDVTLDINFQGLIHFFHHILKITPPILMDNIHMTREKNKLIIKLMLTELLSDTKANE